MLEILTVLLLWACAALLGLYLDARCDAKREKALREELMERFDEYMQKHEHHRFCDLCDNRVGCEKYAGKSKLYIACPFFEHKDGG